LPRNNDSVLLYDIHRSVERILKYTSKGREDFMSTDLVQDGVMRNLGVIGEAASKLSESAKSAMPEIPWAQVIGLRNVVVHEYAVVDPEVVWRVISNDLGALLAAVKREIGP
jgi:uncharacterized protein with HEPN domain